MKKNVMIKFIGGGSPRFILPKGGAHWANRAFSDQTSERRSEA